MPITNAKHMANEKYNAKAYDEIKVRVPKGHKDTIQTAAEGNGESVNGFINRLINAEIERLSGSEQIAEQPLAAAVEEQAHTTFLEEQPLEQEQEVPMPRVSAKLEVERVAEEARRMIREQFEAERRKEILNIIDNKY